MKAPINRKYLVIGEQEKVQGSAIPTYFVRQSKSYLFINFFLIQIMLIIALILIIVLINVFNPLFDFSLNLLTTVAFITLIVLDVYFSLRLIWNWYGLIYIIRPRHFTVRKGILEKKEKSFEINQLETISIKQGFLGRMYDYGTISIFSPVLQENIRITHVPQPKKFENIITMHPDQAVEEEKIVRVYADDDKPVTNSDSSF